jgi:hypothetical protein
MHCEDRFPAMVQILGNFNLLEKKLCVCGSINPFNDPAVMHISHAISLAAK